MSDEGLPVEESRQRERASLALELPVEPLDCPVRMLVLQHPQEPDKVLGSAALLVRALKGAKLKVGLSWPSLSKALGEEAKPAEWAVLYLGAKDQIYPREVNFVSKKGNPVDAPPEGVRGLIVLDGTWSQAKALWWRNAWLLKCKRVVLRPRQVSRYGNLRKEPRKEAVSTMESAAIALGEIAPGGAKVRERLESDFQRMLDEFKSRRRANPPTAKP